MSIPIVGCFSSGRVPTYPTIRPEFELFSFVMGSTMSSPSEKPMFDADAESFLEQARKRAAKMIEEEVQNGAEEDDRDIFYLLKATTSLIAINKEIWNRCKEQQQPKSGHLHMRRLCISKVYCSTRSSSNSIIRVYVMLEEETKDFGKLPEIPSATCFGIDSSFGVQTSQPFARIPDYEDLIDKQIGILREEFAMNFLIALKQHLENLQVFLGSIETWLLQIEEDASFLENLFGTKINREKPGVHDSVQQTLMSCLLPYDMDIKCNIDISNEKGKSRLTALKALLDKC